MRNPVKDRQKVWFSTVEEHKDGIDQWKVWTDGIVKKMRVGYQFQSG